MNDKQLNAVLVGDGRRWRETERDDPPALADLLRSSINRGDADEPVPLDELPTPARRRWPVAVSVTAAAAVVVGVASVAVALSHPSARSSRSTQSTRSTQATSQPTASASGSTSPIEDPKTVATQAATALLHQLVLPSGAVSLAATPDGLPAGPVSSFGGNRVIDEFAWWQVPLSPAAAAAFFQAHPSPGVRFSGTATEGIAGRPPTIYAVMFDGTQSSPAYSQLTLQVAIAADGPGSAIRVDAQAMWRPARTAAEMIPTPVTSVDLTLTRGQPPSTGSAPPPTQRTITGPEAQHLAALVNALPIASDAPSTGVAFPDRTVLVFHTKTGTPIIVSTGLGGIGWTYLAGSASLPELDTSPALYAEINQLVGAH